MRRVTFFAPEIYISPTTILSLESGRDVNTAVILAAAVFLVFLWLAGS